ncbi:MAG: hypothetical protein GXP16_15260 [Gammaproteobacteria bacterium]|nr:hypothetical protein [Gammaproteobacteria bacterium]
MGWDIPAFVSCVEINSAAAVNSAVTQAESTMQESPLMAAAGFEASMLQLARNNDLLAVKQCLQDTNIELGSVVTNWLNSPVDLARERIEHLLEQTFNPQKLTPLFAQISATKGTPAALNLNAQFDKAWALVIHTANQDPLTKCGIPLLQAQKSTIRQAVTTLYPKITAIANQQIESHFKPAMLIAINKLLQSRIQELTQGASTPSWSSGSSGSNVKSPMQASPARAIQRTTTARTPNRQARTRPRTRAGGTFLDKGAAVANDGYSKSKAYVLDKAQGLVQKYTPEYLELVALGEFARQILVEEGLDDGTATLKALSEALASGNTGSGDFSNLESLISELEATNELLYAHIGLVMIRYHGHKAIDTGGNFIISVTLGSASAVERVVAEAAAVACSPGVMVSESGCSAVKAVVGFMYLQVFVPAAGYVIKEYVHDTWDDAMDCGRQNIENPSIDALNCGSVAALVGWLPKTMTAAAAFAMPYLDATQQSTLAYHNAVLELAQTARATAATP